MAKSKKVEAKGHLALENLPQKTDEEIRRVLDDLFEEEEKISYRRRVLHGQIDIVRAELVQRLKKKRQAGKSVVSAKDLDRLSEILARSAVGASKVDLSDEDVLD